MNKTQIQTRLDELAEQKEQAKYSAQIRLKKEEYSMCKHSLDKLIEINKEIEILIYDLYNLENG